MPGGRSPGAHARLTPRTRRPGRPAAHHGGGVGQPLRPGWRTPAPGVQVFDLRNPTNGPASVLLDRRWAGEGIRANALHPGAIATNLQRHTGGLKTPEPYRKTVEQGAATSVFLAASPLAQYVGGRYFEDVNESPRAAERPTELGVPGVAPYALDPANAERLWELAHAVLR
ncbi:hypothetical protein AB0N16_36375 [Streptomyces sp. NPDC051105]|uniref:hypothetical protein n=1 Tax=Streptomyces sp. NPDC051105 TaxID=3154843 RepID=UPI00342DFF72